MFLQLFLYTRILKAITLNWLVVHDWANVRGPTNYHYTQTISVEGVDRMSGEMGEMVEMTGGDVVGHARSD